MEKINTLGYSIVQGAKNLKRNRMFSLTSIFTITACLFLFGIMFFLVSNVQYMLHNMEDAITVTAFFDEGITEERIAEIGTQLRNRSDVKQVTYVSADEAWTSFQNDVLEDQQELAETFVNDNPLADSSSYEITVESVEQQSSLVKDLKNMDGIRKVNSSDEAARMLTNFNRFVSVVSLAVILILIVVSVFLISTTITVGISVRKEEIGIMRLIGATDFFVQGPFIVEGILIGFTGALFPLGILAIFYEQLMRWVSHKFGMLSNWLTFLPMHQEFAMLVPVCLGIGVGIGLLGSCITVKKHLRV